MYMNTLNVYINKHSGLKKTIYILIFLLSVFIFLKTINFFIEFLTSFLILVAALVITWLVSIFFIKKDNNLILFSSIIFLWIFIEFTLYKVSPYKGELEINGWMHYQSRRYKEGVNHFKEPYSENTYDWGEFTMNIKTNQWGLRDDDVALEKIKILLLGDSFVEGWGLEATETIDKHLENHFDCDKCVLNAGSSGSDLVAAYKAMMQLFEKKLEPDLVILNINSTDFQDVFTRYVIPNKPTSLLFEFIYGTSFIARHLSHLFLDIDIYFLNEAERIEYDKKSKELIKETLLKFNETLNKKQIGFFVILQPLQGELVFLKYPLTEISKFLEQNQISHYDAFYDFQALENPEVLFWPKDGHFNKEGSDFFSVKVFNELNSQE